MYRSSRFSREIVWSYWCNWYLINHNFNFLNSVYVLELSMGDLHQFVQRDQLSAKWFCSICGNFTHASKGNVINHVESKHFCGRISHFCDICGHFCKTKNALQNHKTRAHKTSSWSLFQGRYPILKTCFSSSILWQTEILGSCVDYASSLNTCGGRTWGTTSSLFIIKDILCIIVTYAGEWRTQNKTFTLANRSIDANPSCHNYLNL